LITLNSTNVLAIINYKKPLKKRVVELKLNNTLTVRFDDGMKRPVYIRNAAMLIRKIDILALIITIIILGVIAYGLWLPYNI